MHSPSEKEKSAHRWRKLSRTWERPKKHFASKEPPWPTGDRIIDAILRSAEQTSEELKQTLRALAEKQAEVAIEEAGKEIKRLERQAINDLRSEVSAMVVDVAGKLIDSELTNRHQSMLIDSAIMSLASVEA
ncbi:MAG TPA: ATP synthase F0 subunit B [Bacteroidota bacterium]